MGKLYFAYGSNLFAKQMKERCPSSVPVGRAILRGYELTFKDNGRGRGVASISPKKKSKVHGYIYELTKECEATLDKFEGVKSKVYKKEYVQVESGSGDLTCLTYIMYDNFKEAMPKLDYFKKIYNGYGDWYLPKNDLLSRMKQFKNQFTK